MNYAFNSADNRICLRMITEESFDLIQKSILKIARRRSKFIEKIFAVFEVEPLKRFMIITEGLCHNAENYQVFRVNCLEKPYLSCFDQETLETLYNFECNRILIDSHEYLNKVEQDIEFLARVGRFGFTVVVFKLIVESLNSADIPCKVDKGQVVFKVVDIFQESFKGSWMSFLIGKRKRALKKYKDKILKNFKGFVKSN